MGPGRDVPGLLVPLTRPFVSPDGLLEIDGPLTEGAMDEGAVERGARDWGAMDWDAMDG
jgi:hypothetical protein